MFGNHIAEKSDTSVVPEKPSNKRPGPAEIVEEKDVAKRSTNASDTDPDQLRVDGT
jgi:hypothetical protein